MVHWLGLGKVRHLAVGDLRVQHHARSGNIRVSKMSGLDNHKPSTLGRNHCCVARKRVIGPLSLMMAGRDECRWVVLCRRVDFVGHQELVQNTATHGQK